MISGLVLALTLLSFSLFAEEIRGVIDVGSGGTKVLVARVDENAGVILEVLFQDSFPVAYSKDLSGSSDGTFSTRIQEQGLAIFEQIADLFEDLGVESITAGATEAFRKAKNGQEFVHRVELETGIPLTIFTQEDEAWIAFYSAESKSGVDGTDLIVWDIGTGSYQITALLNGELEVLMGSVGSVPFKDFIVQEVLIDEDSDSVLDLDAEGLSEADRFARSLGRQASKQLKQAIKDQGGHLYGIGRLFAASLGPLAEPDGLLTRSDLRKFIRETLEADSSLLDDPFLESDLSNAILALAFMKALHIHSVTILETTSTEGLIIAPMFWEGAETP